MKRWYRAGFVFCAVGLAALLSRGRASRDYVRRGKIQTRFGDRRAASAAFEIEICSDCKVGFGRDIKRNTATAPNTSQHREIARI